jgi:hypothetical protein
MKNAHERVRQVGDVEADLQVRLERSLRTLAIDDARTSGPPNIRDAVMHAWNAFQASETSSRRWLRRGKPMGWALAASAAAAIVVLAVLPRGRSVEPSRPVPLARSETVPPTTVFEDKVEPDVTDVRTGRSERRVPLPPAPQQPEGSRDFGYVLVPDPVPDSAPLSVMRVRMPRSAFATLGLPIVNPNAEGFVDVEVLVGEDGIARAIRRTALVSSQ